MYREALSCGLYTRYTPARLALLTIFTFVSFAAPFGARAAECRTPSEYATAFDKGADCSVDSCLYSVITQADTSPAYPYPEGFGKAWLSGNRTLAAVLQLKRRHGGSCRLTEEALRMVGFAPPFDDAPYRLHVIDGCDLEKRGHTIGIPTVAEWMRVLEDAYAIKVPMPIFRELAESGMDFEGATGCRDQRDTASGMSVNARDCVAAAKFPDQNTCSCAPEFVATYRTLRVLSPYDAGRTTAECFAAFQRKYRPSVPALRAALWACQDVNPYNTFNGLGFDGTELTWPEFIVDNVPFNGMGRDGVAALPLPDPIPCKNK